MRFLIPLCVAVSVLIASALPAGIQDEVDVEKHGGFVSAGKEFLLVEDTSRAYGLFSSKLTILKPAREVRELMSYNDTLWIATDGGLFCYSTFQDTIVEVTGNFAPSIWALAVNDDGWLYVGDESGMSVRKGGRWLRYSSRSNKFFSHLRDIVCTDGSVWLASFGNGCALLDADTLTTYTMKDSLLDNRVNRILLEDPYSVLFGTESGLCKADTSRWESYRYGKRIPLGAIRDMVFDEGGNLFMAVEGHGVVLYNLMRVKQFGEEDGLPCLEINALSLDSDGVIWAGGDCGIFYFDGSGWAAFESSTYDFKSNRILSLEHNLEGNLFAGTDSGKIIAASASSVREIEIPQKFPANRVSRARRSGGSIWFVADGNLYYKDATSFKPVRLPASWFEGSVMDVLPLAGGRELWVATRFGILHLSEGSWEIFDRRQGLPTDFFKSVVEDSSGNIWFATFDSALLELEKDRWVHHTAESGIGGRNITDMVVDSDGTLWIAINGHSLSRHTSGGWEEVDIPGEGQSELYSQSLGDTAISNLPGIKVLESEKNFPERKELALGVDFQGHLLVATSRAVYLYFANGWQMVRYPTELVGIQPSDVYVATSGEIFLGTFTSGIVVYSKGSWVRLDTSNNLSDNRVLSITEDPWGNLLVGTQVGGLIKISLHDG